jgi:hypothetical protein
MKLIVGHILWLFGFGISSIMAQIPNGAWRDHLPYNQGKKLAEFNNRLYCATASGGLFSYGLSDHSIQKHSKVNGLSDAEVSTIGYSKVMGILVIGYGNGNIDLVKDNQVINIPDVKIKMISGEKSINNISFYNNLAFLACGFGIVICDLEKFEIKDTYIFGPAGTQIFVNDIVFDGQFIYAATHKGIYKADYIHANLVDFNAWIRMGNVPDEDCPYRFLAWFDNRLFTVYHNPATELDEIITISGSGWSIWEYSYPDIYNYLGEQNGFLIFSSRLRTKVYDALNQPVRDVVTYYANHALWGSHQDLSYADPVAGLVRLDKNGNGQVICPEGPAYRDVGDIEIKGGKLWAGGGTNNSKWAGYGAYSFVNEKWTNYNASNMPQLIDFLNISEISIDPENNEHIIGGSNGYGLVEFNQGVLIDIQDELDGVLLPVQGYGHGYVRVTGTDFDPSGSLWVCTSSSDQALYRRRKGGLLEAIATRYDGFGFNTRTADLIATSMGPVWVALERDGIFVLEENDDGENDEIFFSVRNQTGQLCEDVYTLEEDMEGDVWVGTNRGPVVYFHPDEIFTEGQIIGYQPEVPRNDGTLYVDLLLSNEKINDIAVDGANQKWIGTEKSGVYLVSSDGKKELLHFTEDNSPLFSNNVTTLAVNDFSGEVFFGTDKGLISFRGRATEGGEDFGQVYVYPNPVRETYQGDITITGLMRNVNVKITDISGNLIFETTSLGGQAIWDGRNFKGEKVHTGVYLVFCSNEDGSKTYITKLLLIH